MILNLGTENRCRWMNGEVTTEFLWEQLSEQLRSFIAGRVGDHQLVEDLVQEVFVRIHSRLDTVSEQQRLKSWVFTIARNLVIDHYRSGSKSFETLQEKAISSNETREEIKDTVITWLPSMIQQLPPKYRQAIELYELQGCSQQDIADKLDLTLPNVKSRIQRGRAKLKEILLNCCSFEKDRRGNLIDYWKNQDESC